MASITTGGITITLLMILMLLVALFLILLVLVQRGKGGGLAGAFGGMGGQSAFGTKAGDLFTKITVVVASVWIVLCMVAVTYFATPTNVVEDDMLGGAAPPSNPGVQAGAEPDDGSQSAPAESE